MPYRIFIADDSDLLLDAITTMIGDIPGIVVAGSARSHDDSIREIERLVPDLILLDLRLVGGNGLNVLRAVRRTMIAPPIAIIHSSDMPGGLQKLCLQAGAAFALTKEEGMSKLELLLRSLASNESAI